MYEVIFSPQALKDAVRLKRSEPKAFTKLNTFVEEEKPELAIPSH